MIVSSDNKHDSFTVDTFVDKALSHLKENGIPVKRIIMWSNNCSTQYKSCKVFDSMSKFKAFQLCTIISVQNMERFKQIVPLDICLCT